MNIPFANWRAANPFIESSIFLPQNQDKNGRWGKIQAHWNEKKLDGKILSHLCHFTIDLQSGDIYSDCRKRKIWTKCVLLNVGRPFMGFFKTMYHLALPISIPLEIFKAVFDGVQQQHSSKQIFQASMLSIVHNIADIVRTPIYATAMTIVTLMATIVGPFVPIKLYDFRALFGRLDQALNRGEDNLWNMAPCFQPLQNVMRIHHLDFNKSDTVYENNPTLHGLNNLARSYVGFRRKHHNLFNDCGLLQPKNKAYVSAGS